MLSAIRKTSWNSEGNQPLGVYPQAEFFLDLSQAVQRLFSCRQVSCGGDVEVAGPGVFGGCAALEEQVRAFGIRAADPTVKTTVPQPQPVRLALKDNLPRRPSSLVQDIYQLVHANKGSTSADQDLRTRTLTC